MKMCVYNVLKHILYLFEHLEAARDIMKAKLW